MDLSVLKYTGEATGRMVPLPESVFGVHPNDHAIYLAVKSILAGQRQGTHQTKERNAVRGSRRKIKRQKHTGGARAGDIKSPLFRGGGRIFGPRPRDYGFKLNQKVKKLARRSVLTYKAREERITLLEPFAFDSPKTKTYLQFLQNLSLAHEKTLLILPQVDVNMVLASRNIPRAQIRCVTHLNAYDLLHATRLLIVESALATMVQILT